ncbi:MAG: ribonuclease R [Hominimerdicola sp.]
MKIDYRKLIYNYLKTQKKPVSFKVLLKNIRCKKFDFDKFVKVVEKMKKKGELIEDKKGFSLVDFKKLTKCEVVRLNKTYGFVKNVETGEEIFIVGKFLKGAMPHDIVMVRTFEGEGESLEGEVMAVIEENFNKFTGELVKEFGVLKIVPDVLSKYSMDFENPFLLELHEGDKVVAEITKRGERHSEHKCQVVSAYGSSMRASACALSILEVNGLTPVFPNEVLYEAKIVSDYSEIEREAPNRLDLRDKPIFTIDGADTKDIDDAISVEKTADGYLLGVHIADVSHYVKPKSALDNEAFNRGTSIYYANRVIPMLPKELSNGICSLNPQEDRLAFSCLCNIDKNGTIKDYKFAKSIIRSRVKGVYSEINEMLEGYNSKANCEKYAEVMDQLPIIKELADILWKKKIARGAPQLETAESKLIIDERDICVDVVPRKRGRCEEIIEDFMLAANECAARFGVENNLPFVYRIHEEPSLEKVEGLKEGLAKLDILYKIGEKATPADMSAILAKVKGSGLEMIVNNMVLRSMSKAKYSTEPIGHYGLVLADYAHFTSPIRRYPDLTIHRIMSAFLDGMTASQCAEKFTKFSYASADRSTSTELLAMQTERSCEDCYKAEYMLDKIGETFVGRIVSVTDFGMFVILPNTCEGLLHTDNMGEGYYESDGMISLTNIATGAKYRVGDEIRVKVINANVNSGKIDFALEI